MPNQPDMDTPVTRREMHEAFEIWGGAMLARFADLLTKFADLDTKVETLGTKFETLETRIVTKFEELETRLGQQLASWSRSNSDDLLATLPQSTRSTSHYPSV